MDPELMRKAMDQMSKFTPQQIADMQRQMASLPPGFIEQQMQAMQSMSPEMLQQRMAEADSIDPTAAQAQLKDAVNRAKQQEEYQVRVSAQLKEEGNRLFTAQDLGNALDKYTRAKTNLKNHNSVAAAQLKTKCMLNMASCQLRLGKNQECIDVCSEVLSTHPDNVKALYRRGQARLVLKQKDSAIADLRKALARAPIQERPLILEKLNAAGDLEEDVPTNGAAPSSTGDAMKQESEAAAATAVGQASAPVPQASSSLGMDPQQMQATLQMMRENPSTPEQMRTAFAHMSPEQLQAAAKAAGVPDGLELPSDVLRGMADSIASMSPGDIQGMMSAVEASRARDGSQSFASPFTSPTPDSQQMQQAAAALQANPELMSQAMKMFRSMDRQQMEQLARSMGGPGTAGGAPDAAAMSAMLKDPESAMMVKNMMSQLTPKQLVQMSEASGSKITPQQAEEMSRRMNEMSDQQLNTLLKGAALLQSGVSLLQEARARIAANKLLVLGILLLLIALLLRYFNIL